MKAFSACILFACLALTAVARADEGMWTVDNFPSANVQAAYGFSPSKAWLDHVRTGALRIAGGCSASFVSPHGLIMTNHHCAIACISSLSSSTNDYTTNGFYAKSDADEPKCPGYEIDQLQTITNVTPQMLAATRGTTGTAFTLALRAENARLQKACATDPSIRCDVVSLYHGGIYDVYKYRRYRDIRLAFAPEYAVAQFGGDPDNFNFPRFDFDVSFLRAYVKGQPASTPGYLHWSAHGSKAGDPVFAVGNPGATQRLLTVSELSYLRDVALPRRIASLSELRGLLEQYQTNGSEERRSSTEDLFGIENSYKVVWGQLAALDDPSFFSTLERNEQQLRRAVAARPALQRQYGRAWDDMAKVQRIRKRELLAYTYKTGGALTTTYFQFAQALVRLPAEKAKPNAQRLPEFSDAALVTLPDRLFNPSPIYPGIEEIHLTYSLDSVRREFGPDDAFVKTVLQGRSPADQAHYLISNTKLGDVAFRKALYDGGQAAIDTSTDPFIVLARAIDAQARAVRTQYENDVDNPSRQLSEEIAKARFAISGTSVYPDATFSLRVSYGHVAGFTDDRGEAPPYTTIGGLFNRASQAAPYILPQSWLNAKNDLDLSTPMNLSTTNDIIGGNSGSPLLDKNGAIVGLIFDGNIHSLGGAFGYDPTSNRATSVDSRALIEGLRKVYHADRIVEEIGVPQ